MSPPPRAAGAPDAAADVGAAVLFFALISVAAKLIEVGYLVHDARGPAPLLALPTGLGVDAVAAGLLGWLLRGLRRVAPPNAARWSGAVLSVVLAEFVAANVAAFRLSGSPITLQRAFGADGATVADVELVALGDLGPALVLMLAAAGLAYALLARRALARLAAPLGARLVLTLLLVCGGLLVPIDRTWIRPAGFGLSAHPVEVFALSLFDQPDSGGQDLLPDQWDELLRSHLPLPAEADPPPTVTGATPRNILLYFAEGTPLMDTSLGGHPSDTTPNLARWAQQGLFFRRFYSNYSKSIHAIFAAACSELPPPHHRAITHYNPRIDCGTLPEHLAAADIAQGLFHGGHFSFGLKLALLGDRGFDVTMDAYDFPSGGRWKRNAWGIDDRAMVEATLAWLDTLSPEQRSFAWLVPLAPHYPYTQPADVPALIEGSERKTQYLNAVHFSDQVFDQLMRGLQARGRLDDTLVIWVADHGEAFDEHPRNRLAGRMIYEENVHVPLVFINPRLFPQPQVSDRLGSLIDLTPTILDLWHLPPDPRHRGRSLLAPGGEPRRVVLAAYQGRDTLVGFVESRFKFIHNLRTGTSEYFDLATDPFERRDLSREHPPRMQRYAEQAELYREAQLARLRDYPRLDDDPERLLRDLLAASTARVEVGGDWLECNRTDSRGNRRCPKQPTWVYAGVTHEKASGVRGPCLRVHVPRPGGTFELDVERQALSGLGAIDAILRDASRKKPGDPIEIEIAGVAAGSRQPLVEANHRLEQRPGQVSIPLAPCRGDGVERCRLRFSASRSKNRLVCLRAAAEHR